MTSPIETPRTAPPTAEELQALAAKLTQIRADVWNAIYLCYGSETGSHWASYTRIAEQLLALQETATLDAEKLAKPARKR